MSSKENEVPLWVKLNLTVEEAARYSGIGEHRIRELIKEPGCRFALQIGKKKQLIKRIEFEKFLAKESNL